MKTYLIQSFDHLQVTERREPIFNTFKSRAYEIKQKYNYQFNYDLHNQKHS